MAHFGILCPTATGHLNPMCALGRAMTRRGHRVTVFQIPDGEAKVRAAGLEFVPIGVENYPTGRLGEELAELGRLEGLAAVRWTVELLRRLSATVLREAPEALRKAEVDGLLVDQASPEGSTVADLAGLPHVSVASALPFNQESGVPPWTSGWPYRDAWWARLRNRLGYSIQARLVRPMRLLIREARQQGGLPPTEDPRSWFSSLAQLAQIPAELDFPRRELPPWFHYTGPFHDAEAREPVPFPYERLDGRPLVYASMGTIQNRLLSVFDQIARACEPVGVQLVISLGGSAEPESLPRLPGDPIVVKYAPQLELTGRARLVITHSGMNTTLDTLRHGTPMVGIPVTNDQPAVAARLAWSGAGEVVPLRRLSVERLRDTVSRVLAEPSYTVHARRLQAAIERAGGADRAAEIAERALLTSRPVLAEHAGVNPLHGPHAARHQVRAGSKA